MYQSYSSDPSIPQLRIRINARTGLETSIKPHYFCAATVIFRLQDPLVILVKSLLSLPSILGYVQVQTMLWVYYLLPCKPFLKLSILSLQVQAGIKCSIPHYRGFSNLKLNINQKDFSSLPLTSFPFTKVMEVVQAQQDYNHSVRRCRDPCLILVDMQIPSRLTPLKHCLVSPWCLPMMTNLSLPPRSCPCQHFILAQTMGSTRTCPPQEHHQATSYTKSA